MAKKVISDPLPLSCLLHPSNENGALDSLVLSSGRESKRESDLLELCGMGGAFISGA